MLITCAMYTSGLKHAELSLDQISLENLPKDSFYWVALKDISYEELIELREVFHLHPLAIEDVQRGGQRPKLEEYDSHLFMVAPLYEMKEDILQMGEMFMFVSPQFLISIRRNSDSSFNEVRKRAEKDSDLMKLGAGFAFYSLLDAIVDRYLPVITCLEESIENIETQMFAKGKSKENLMRLYPLKQTCSILKRSSYPLLEAVEKLHGGRVPEISREMNDYFRDIADHIKRFDSSIDFIRESINTAIQVTFSMTGIEDSEITKRLAGWGGIIGVPTALAGIWGMNFEYMPELKLHYGYPIALTLIIGSCLLLFIRLRKLGWL